MNHDPAVYELLSMILGAASLVLTWVQLELRRRIEHLRRELGETQNERDDAIEVVRSLRPSRDDDTPHDPDRTPRRRFRKPD